MATALIVLAAGKGTRMESDLPKVLHKIGHAELLVHAVLSGKVLDPERTVIVVGHQAEKVRDAAEKAGLSADFAVQAEQNGTGHAVGIALDTLSDYSGDIVVLYGDTPFISKETLERVKAARADHDVVVLGFKAVDPARYGRLLTEGDRLKRIVEYKNATDEERAVDFCNSGVICVDAGLCRELLGAIGANPVNGEIYLTDIVEAANAAGHSATAVECDEAETLGVNSRTELSAAEAIFQSRKRAELMADGVSLLAPDSVYFSADTVIGRDAVVEQNVVFGPGVTVESGAIIRAFSHLEGCHVSKDAVVGPYARLRPGAELSDGAKVGNFVEIKNAILGEGAKVNHLSYVGDAEIGENSNIGAGTITCNYDGYSKHKTKIGRASFIGSNTMLVAPVTLGDETMTASGSVITSDLPDGALGIARARQESRPGLARKIFDKLKSAKANSRKV